MGFRRKAGVNRPYEEQGYIYFKSRMYQRLPEKDKKMIRDLCAECAGDYFTALFRFVTTDDTATKICMEEYVSRSTLYRCVRKYYGRFKI